MFKRLISCWGLTCFCRKKKGSRKNASVVKSKEDINPITEMTMNSFKIDDGCYMNPVFNEENKDVSNNPFLKPNQQVVLVHTSEGLVPFLSTNPFIYDCYGEDENCVVNFLNDPILAVTQCPKDYETMTEEWVRDHRRFFKNPMRSFTV